jgi:hypothetical protein
MGRILHEIVKEIDHELKRQFLSHKIENPIRHAVMQRFAMIENFALYDLYDPSRSYRDCGWNVNQSQDIVMPSLFKSIGNRLVIDMIRPNRISSTIQYHVDVSAVANNVRYVIHVSVPLGFDLLVSPALR